MALVGSGNTIGFGRGPDMTAASLPSAPSQTNQFPLEHYSDLTKGQENEMAQGELLPSKLLGKSDAAPNRIRYNRQKSFNDAGRSCYSKRVNNLRKSLYWVIEEPDANHGSLKRASRVTAAISFFMILLSLVCFVFETMPAFADTSDTVWKAVEVVTTLAFTAEYVLRLWVSDVFGTSVINWLIRPMNVCDLLAISPMYIELVIKSSNIQCLRVLRVMRLFKLGRYSQGVQVMSAALTNSLSALYILIFLFFIGVVIFASAVYFTEKLSCPYFEAGGDKGLDTFLEYTQECVLSSDDNSVTFGTCCQYMCRGIPSDVIDFYSLCAYKWRESSGVSFGSDTNYKRPEWEVVAMHQINFNSVFTTMWWACVTMTTVGYGDYVPNNWISKLVSSVAMLSGMLIIAMPFAIVGTKFGEAVAIYEDPEVKAAAIPRIKTMRINNKSFSQGSQAATLTPQVSLARLAAVQGDIRKSMQLKQQILKLQILRDNLWTSVEHAMAELTYEGIMHFDKELLIQDVDDNVLSSDDESLASSAVARGVSMFGAPRASVKPEDDGLCLKSLGIFHRRNCIRRWCIWLSRDWPWFDRIVLMLIMLNSAILAMHDYYPRETKPWENKLDEQTEIVFIVLFTAEFLIKVIAQGFIMERNTYLHDLWNWLDFLVVVTGLISLSMGGEETDFSFLRTVRVLRPLRTLSAIPGMRVLVDTVMLSVHRLMQDVVIMALFLLTTFGILGLHFWGGVLHRLCRVTPQPLHFVQNALHPDCRGWCFDRSSMVQIDLGRGASVSLNSTVVFEAFCRSGSSTISDCEAALAGGGEFYTWPVDAGAGRFCGGAYNCEPSDGSAWEFGLDSERIKTEILLPLGVASVGSAIDTICGNDLTSDNKYGPQIIDSAYQDVTMMTDWAEQTNREEFNWGITRYDHIASAALVIFQCVTLEGWVDIMYMLQDAFSPSLFVFPYFLVLLLLGSFFLVNITLAIVWDEFYKVQVDQKDFDEVENFKHDRDSDEAGSITASEGVKIAMKTNPTAVILGNDDYNEVKDLPGVDRKSWARGVRELFMKKRESALVRQTMPRRSGKPCAELLLEHHPWKVVHLARQVANSTPFNVLVMTAIAANVVVLAMDMYRETIIDYSVAETLNLAFNVIFIIEFVILHIALNPINYWLDFANAFDGIIVILSVFDIAMKNAGSDKQGGGSGVTAIRAFRLLRVFKLAKRFPQMRNLLKAAMETLRQMRDYVFLLFLIIFVFTLIGQSFFGGKFLFDSDTGRVITPAEQPTLCPMGDGDKPVCVPRAHFDTFVWGFITIFQILTGENWNVVMYDGIKAAGWGFMFYFVMVVVFGNFVILNLFLALLIFNFEMAHERMKAQELERAQQREQMKELLSARRQEAFQEIGPNTQDAIGTGNLASRTRTGFLSEPGQEDMTWSSSIQSLRRNSDKVLQRAVSWGRKVVEPEDVEVDELRGDVHRLEPEQPPATWAGQHRVNPVLGQGKDTNDLKVENVSDTSTNDQKNSGTSGTPGPLSQRIEPAPTGESLPAAAAVTTSETVSKVVESKSKTSETLGALRGASRASLGEDNAAGKSEQVSKLNTTAKVFLTALNTNTGFQIDMMDEAERERERQRKTENEELISSRSRPSNLDNRRSGGESMWQRSLFIFDDEGTIRDTCLRLIKHPWFDKVIIFLIGVSSASMMFSNPLNDPDSPVEKVLHWANVVFTFVFAGEMLIKIVALGLIFNNPTVRRPAYLRSSWNIADAAIVTVSLTDMFQTWLSGGSSDALSFIKIFRIARLLRPLRLISRLENLKVVVHTIIVSIPELRNMLLFISIIFLIFGMLGVSYFKGSFYSCRDQDLEPFSFVISSDWTSLCIPLISPSANSPNATDMRFSQQQSESACSESSSSEMEFWHRPTRQTPICEVQCQGNPHPFCMNTKPWGYHVMRCSDCQATFCPNPQKNRESCENKCSGHQLFCAEEHENNAECRKECVAECMCSDFCNGLSDDAALCVEQGGRWINTDQHFNNILDGWVSLFEISTTEGWVDLMYAAVDSQGPMKQPKRDSTEVIGISIFVSFILVGTFFVLNLCVGVIINNYHEQTMKKGQLQINLAQQRWVAWQKALYSRRFFFAQTNLNLLSPTRQHLTNIVNSNWFDNAIMACILLNTLVLGMQWYPRPPHPYNHVLEQSNLIFALVFNVEAAMKLAAMHTNYFKESWNIFDFCCVVISDAFLVVEATVLKADGEGKQGGSSVELGSAVNTIRIFRIARLFRLVRFLKGLNQLFYAFILSLPKLANVFMILCLLIFLYAVMGINLFAKVGYLGGAHNEQANFRTFMGAVTVLVRSMTGEGWNFIMHDLSKTRFYYETYLEISCDENFIITPDNFAELDLDNDGVVDNPIECGTAWSYVYFITYTVSVTFVVYNLFIAVILDGYYESQQSEVNDIIETCIEVWKKYDPECVMLLPLERALDYIDEVVGKLCVENGTVTQEAIPWYQMSRWDDQYTGEIDRGVHSWAYYSLEYMRVLNLKITDTPEFDVRIIVALKAVIRRLVVQGGLRFQALAKSDMRRNLVDLEMIDQIDYEELKVELHKLRQLELKQARLLVLGYPPLLNDLDKSPSSISVGQRSKFDERFLPEEVAAAKIQRRIKELLQRRRARYAQDSGDADGRINRAAG